MALVERLDDLPMTRVEQLLKDRFFERTDIAGRILSSQELSDYTGWLIRNYGKQHGSATRDMLPYFTPDNRMTRLAARVSSVPDDDRAIGQLSGDLSEQSEEGYIAPGQDISVGRMLRYYPGHWHTTTYFDIYYAFSGECPIHFQDETVVLKKGSVLIVAPGVVHASPCYSDDAVLAFYMMRASTFKRVFWDQLGEGNLLSRFFHLALESDQPTSYLYFETDIDPDVRQLLLQVYRERQEDQLYALQITNALMSLFFLLLLRRYEGTARLPRTEHFYWKHEFSAILSYIQTHYPTATIAEVAARFNYSTKQVGRIVREHTGESFGDLVRMLKMKRAADLLQDRRFSPEQVADSVGYASVHSFYRAFTEYYGKPPMEWLAQ